MPLTTFLVEKYWPDASRDSVLKALERAKAEGQNLEAEGRGVSYLEFAYVPKDETLVCLARAAAIEDVLEAGARAGVPFDRVAEADSLGVKR